MNVFVTGATGVIGSRAVPLLVAAGVYSVADDEPLRRSDFLAAIAAALRVPTPKPPPSWIGRFMGSMGEMLERSLRISNRKLRDASPWRPRYPSAREGWRSVVQETAPPAQLRTA